MAVSLRTRLYAGYLSIIILFLIAVGVSTYMSQRIVQLTHDILLSEKRMESVDRLNLLARMANDDGAHYMLAPQHLKDNFKMQFETNVSYLNQEIIELAQITAEEEGKAQIIHFKSKWASYLETKRRIMSLKDSGDLRRAQEQYTKDYFDPIAFALLAFSKNEQAKIDAYKLEIDRSGKTINLVNFTMVALAILLSLGIAVLLSNYLTRRIRELKLSAQRVAEGDLQVPDLIFRGQDELRDLAEAFNTMTGSLRSALNTNQSLQALSNMDGLTGIANRRRYDEWLEQEWPRMAAEGKRIALILMDIDYFKQYNDLYGHQVGDDCLQKVAGVFQYTVNGPKDLAARYGGEEFAVLLPGRTAAEAALIAEFIQRSISNLRIPHQGSQVSDCLTVSMGIASIQPRENPDPEQLLVLADQALYEAKRQGRNRVCLAEDNQLT